MSLDPKLVMSQKIALDREVSSQMSHSSVPWISFSHPSPLSHLLLRRIGTFLLAAKRIPTKSTTPYTTP